MDIVYTVHSSSPSKVAVEVPYNGMTVEALVDGLVVELVSTDGTMGHTLRLIPEDLAAAQELFAVGAVVKGTYTAGGD